MSYWPALDFEKLQESHHSLHMWSQIIGKFRLAQSPWINHSWQATLYVNARGVTTGLIPGASCAYEVSLDFIDHGLVLSTTDGRRRSFALESMSVAEFWDRFTNLLKEVGAPETFHHAPNELPEQVPFAQQTDVSGYGPEVVRDFWLAMVAIHQVMQKFRSGYLGKVSPVHLFWGSFDLAVTRFSGREAPKHPGGIPNLPDPVSIEAYSHEVSSAGFWAGGNIGYPAFYCYAYPTPKGFAEAEVKPSEAFYDEKLGEFLLPYSAVQSSADPEAALMDFLQSTYLAAAELGGWPRESLECEIGEPCVPRKV